MVYLKRKDIIEKLEKMKSEEVIVGTEQGYVGVANVLELSGRVVVLIDNPTQQILRGAYNE